MLYYQLVENVNKYEVSKDEALHKEITAENTKLIENIKILQKKVDTLLAEKPTDHLLLWYLESQQEGLKIIANHLNLLEERIKKAKAASMCLN